MWYLFKLEKKAIVCNRKIYYLAVTKLLIKITQVYIYIFACHAILSLVHKNQHALQNITGYYI